MIYLEMSRDAGHGGGTWSFPNCLWAPTHKQSNRGGWPFWSKVGRVEEGDIILHLRGIRPDANFVGYSRASGNGFETTSRPPEPRDWGFATSFYRADLTDFIPFHQPVNLDAIFRARRSKLENYLKLNRERRSGRINVFYVLQSGRLQCLNGAYLSDLDEEMLEILFDERTAVATVTPNVKIISVETAAQIATIFTRIGQTKFARQTKQNYSNSCCFPGCGITDIRFLAASHIARWADNETLRGHPGNGLCFCLLHDKAFELGLFTLDQHFRIYVNQKENFLGSSVVRDLLSRHGHKISLPQIAPLEDALLEHWIRVGIDPLRTF